MKCFIIIVTYNGLSWIKKCITSISDKYSVIIVDNNSSDDTVSYIENFHPNIILVKQTLNLGFGAANNIGISLALKQGADFIFLLNQDAYLFPKTIEVLLEISKKHPEYGILSPIHLNGKGDGLDSNFSNYIKINNDLLFDALRNKYSKNIYEVPFVNAAAWLLTRTVIEKIGGFDPIFFHYGEDDNYCQRLIYHGFKIGIVPKTYVNHDREDRRVLHKVDTYSRLKESERILKFRLANINNSKVDVDLFKIKKKLIKTILKLLFKFKFRKAKYYFLELLMVKKKIPEIVKSRELNKKSGSIYLQ
jgi:GT2 family glycosyltransferase